MEILAYKVVIGNIFISPLLFSHSCIKWHIILQKCIKHAHVASSIFPHFLFCLIPPFGLPIHIHISHIYPCLFSSRDLSQQSIALLCSHIISYRAIPNSAWAQTHRLIQNTHTDVTCAHIFTHVFYIYIFTYCFLVQQYLLENPLNHLL